MFSLDKNFVQIDSLFFEEDSRMACPTLQVKFIMNKKEVEDPRKGLLLQNHVWEVESFKMVDASDSYIFDVSAVPAGMNSILPGVSSPSEIALRLPNYSLNPGDSSPSFLPKVVNCTAKKLILRNRLNFLEEFFNDPGNAYYIYAAESKIYCNTYKSLLSQGVYEVLIPTGLSGSLSSSYVDDTTESRGGGLPPSYLEYSTLDYLNFMITEKIEIQSSVRLAPLFANCSLELELAKGKNWVCVYHTYNLKADPLSHTTVFAQLDLKTIPNYIKESQ